MENRKIISDREQKEWYADCPIQITRNCIEETGDTHVYSVSLALCTDKEIEKIEITAHFSDLRRVALDTLPYTISLEASSSLPCPTNAVYVHTVVESVYLKDGSLLWERKDASPIRLPEQEILWQTDPLYAQIRRECEGIVKPVYRPDTIDGGWRCTCGHINLDARETCGVCHTNHQWLITHFDPEFLKSRQEAEKTATAQSNKKTVNYRNEKVRADQRKLKLIYASFGLVIALIVLLFTWIIPSLRYSSAEKALANGEYDTAIAIFTDLNNFRDADKRAEDAVHKKAQFLTGLFTVNMVTTQDCPWFSISEDGVLTLYKDKYTGSWNHFVVPDMVDGILVKELCKNFFLNCQNMVSVTLSDCIEVLGEQTFFNCESLTDIQFGSSLTTISPRAFINCYSLTSISIPDTVKTIGLRAFNSCENLKKVSLGTGITVLPSYLFSCCYSLEEVTLYGQVTNIAAYAFSECRSLETLYYAGTKEQWNTVVIDPEENTALEKAEIITLD